MTPTNKDFLHKYLVLNKEARVITVFSTNTVNDYLANANPSLTGSVAMGRLISATLMMGSLLKGNEKVMLSIEGNGPIGMIRAEADCLGNVRAFASHPQADAPLKENHHFDVPSIVGTEGILSVRKQLNMKEPFIGTSELISGEIGEDLSYYYGISEQTPTVVALGVKLNENGKCAIAGGFMIQLLPKASEESYQYVEELLTKVKSVSSLLLQAQSSDQLVHQLFQDPELILENEVRLQCNCSLKKTMMLLTQLSEEELDDDIRKNQGLDVTCNFCQKTYHITTDMLRQVKEDKKNDIYRVK